jgi:hypothetical protein
MAQKTLSVKLELLTKDFSKNLNKSVSEVINSTKKITKNIQTLGAKMSVALALPATLISKSLLKMAGEAEDANGRITAVFGDSAPKIEKSLLNLSKIFGRNTTDLKNYASEFGSLFTSMDLTESEAGDLSRSLVQLGIDVASLKGISDSKVMEAFTSSLTGNVKSLKQLGISISDAEIENEAFILGINKTKEQLNERDKALVMSSLLHKTFEKSIGSTSKSQEGWGEVMNRFNAKVKTLQETFGKELIPIVSSLIDKIMPLIDYFISLDDSVKRGAMTVLAFAVLLPPLITVVGTLSTALITATGIIWSLIKGLAVAISSVLAFTASLISKAFAFFVANVGAMVTAVSAFASVALPIVVIIGSVIQIIRMAIVAFAGLAGIFADNAKVIVDKFGPAILILLQSMEKAIETSVFLANIGKGFDEASRLATNAIMGINTSIGDLKQEINNPKFTGFSDSFREEATKIEVKLNDMAEDFDATLIGIGSSVKGAIGDTADWVKSKMGGAWDTVADGAKSAFTSALEYMKNLAIGSLSLLGDFNPFGKAKQKPVPEVAQEDPNIKSMAKNEMPSFIGVGGSSTADLKQSDDTNLKDKIESQKTIWTELAEHIENSMITASTVVSGLWDNVFNNFSQGISNMILDGASFAETFKSMFKSLADFVIQNIVKMGMQWLMTELMKRTVSSVTSKIVQADAITTAGIATASSVASSKTMIANNAIVAGSGAASSQAGIPIIGPILAIAAMGAMIATVMGLQGKLKLASGGITQGPTNALIGEKGQEAVIPLDRLDSMLGNREQTIIMNLDGRTLARTVIKNSPREIRLSTGVLM